MSAMAESRLDTVLSFRDADAPPASPAVAVAESATTSTPAFSDAGSVSGDSDAEDSDDFEFAFAPPLSPGGSGPALAPADDLFAHGRIVAAYPLFDRHLLLDDEAAASSPDHHRRHPSTTAPPSPDAYCAWAPRSAPGSPSRDAPTPAAAFPKSSSTGESRRFWRLRDLVAGGGGRSHSDGKEKFVFLQCRDGKDQKHAAAAAANAAAALQKQGKKKKGGKGKAAGAAETMDMATAHRLFYGKPGSAALAGDRPRQHQQSYLPYRAFFASAHVLGRSHHPY